MSMKLLTVLQFTQSFLLYILLTVLLPALVFGNKIKERRFAVRFLIYFTAGNFYFMNLVYLLQLLHISNRFTLILLTLVPAFGIWVRLNQVPLPAMLHSAFGTFQKLVGGQLGFKTFVYRSVQAIGKKLVGFLRRLYSRFVHCFVDILLVTGLTAMLLWVYGTNLLETYGYCVSDMPVHNYWINYMGTVDGISNRIFAAGVYPFGFHCIIYYLHTVFAIDTYVILRVFGVVQALLIHYVLLAFLKACCRSRYAPYVGVGIFAAAGIFNPNTFWRYYSALPQEFGMLFILPAIYFAFSFFRVRKKELDYYKEKKTSHYDLILFALSFSMTLAVHFYGTMIAGLFCIGIAAGYSFRFLRLEYFKKVVFTCFISVFIAVLPMGIAFATGTPLQGSLGWGLNVITGEGEETSPPEDTEANENTEAEVNENTENAGITLPPSEDNQTAPRDTVVLYKSTLTEKLESAFKGMTKLLGNVGKVTRDTIDVYVFEQAGSGVRDLVFVSLGILLAGSILFFLRRETDYAAMLLSTAVFMLLMTLLLIAKIIGLPPLMDTERTSIYYAYMLPVLWSLAVDVLLAFGVGWMKRNWLMDYLSLVCVCGVLIVMTERGMIREPMILTGLESNEAVTCLTNIIKENEDFTWTICSANDETRMGQDHGYHYEISDFLKEMEYFFSGSLIRIPTKKVYFFIEKVPLDYTVEYEGSGRSISEAGASGKLPVASGIAIYEAENRFILMSRMYYWAQKFIEMYPNEMKIYYETDDFVCYQIEQNDYRLYDFAIDYGYNQSTLRER